MCLTLSQFATDTTHFRRRGSSYKQIHYTSTSNAIWTVLGHMQGRRRTGLHRGREPCISQWYHNHTHLLLLHLNERTHTWVRAERLLLTCVIFWFVFHDPFYGGVGHGPEFLLHSIAHVQASLGPLTLLHFLLLPRCSFSHVQIAENSSIINFFLFEGFLVIQCVLHVHTLALLSELISEGFDSNLEIVFFFPELFYGWDVGQFAVLVSPKIVRAAIKT